MRLLFAFFLLVTPSFAQTWWLFDQEQKSCRPLPPQHGETPLRMVERLMGLDRPCELRVLAVSGQVLIECKDKPERFFWADSELRCLEYLVHALAGTDLLHIFSGNPAGKAVPLRKAPAAPTTAP